MQNKSKLFNENIESLKKLFESLRVKEGEPCVYCGLLATDKEHVFPRSWIEEMKKMKEMGFDVKVPKEIIVPSCRECNLIASDFVFSSLKEKKTYIRKKLLKKYKKFLTTPTWSDEEIQELSGRLREQVFIYNEIVKIMKRRLERLKTSK
jgi:hypothetical protein